MDNGASSYRRFLDGDDEGIAQIVEEHKDGLILYLNRYVRNIHIAEELAEDTFFRVITGKAKFRGKCSFKTWLYSIAHHVAVDQMRRSSKGREIPLDEVQDILRDETDLERHYIRAEQISRLYGALKRIPEAYSTVLYLVYIEGFSNGEAACVLHKTDRQIRNLLYRGKLSLKSELEKDGFCYEEL